MLRQCFWITSASLAAISVANAAESPAADPGQADAPAAVASKESAADSNVGIGDIIVTAQKRSESAQSVPLAITALSGDLIRERGIVDAAGLQAVVPNIQVATQIGNVLIGIRGIYSITAVTPNGSPEVAVSVDGVYQSRAYAITGAFFDIDRIEVLRGPQGTLYGRNATGGSVNIVTKKPSTADYSAEGSLGFGNYDELSGSAALNAPLGSNTAVRASINFLSHKGYIGGYYNDADDKAGRLQLLTRPSDNLSILVSGYYFSQSGHGGADVIVPFVTSDHWENSSGYPLDGRQDNRHWGINGQIDWNLGGATLTYIPAFLRVGINQQQAYTVGIQYSLRQVSEQYTQELRLASDSDASAKGQLKWLMGLYWLREDQHYSQQIPLFFFDNNVGLKIESYAAFGQLTYALTDEIRVTGGLRYTRDKSQQRGTGSNFGAPTIIAGRDVSTNVGWRIGIDADVGPESMVYAQASSGYKAGGQWSGGIANNNFKPETLIAYEAGTKNRFLDNRLQLNAAAFLYDYKNYQATTTILLPGSGFIGATYNAGRSRLYGVELESVFQPTPNDQLTLNITAEKAYFRTFFLPPATDLAGKDLPMVSRLTVSGSFQHSFDLPNDASLVARVSSRYASRYFPDFTNAPASRQGAFTNTEASLRYSTADGHWSMTAYIKNIENIAAKTYYLVGLTSGTASISAPRTYGVRADFKF